MSTVIDVPASIETLADLVERLGDIPLSRIRFRPLPGTATEQDVLDVERREKRRCELIDGVLVEKQMGYRESVLAALLIEWLGRFVRPRNLGHVSGEGGMLRLFPGLVRIPDVAFASWKRFPLGRLPDEPIPDLVPDLAIEVLSTTNTAAEMRRKLEDYFSSGVSLVLLIDPRMRTATVCTAPDSQRTIDATGTVDAGAVLPGFEFRLADLFAELDRQAGPRT